MGNDTRKLCHSNMNFKLFQSDIHVHLLCVLFDVNIQVKIVEGIYDNKR